MNREEKTAFWFFTMLIKNQVSPDYLYLNNREIRERLEQYFNFVVDYLKSGQKIPFAVLDFIKKNTSLEFFRNYMRETEKGLKSKSKIPTDILEGNYRMEKDRNTIILLFKEIDKEEEHVYVDDDEMKEESERDKKLLLDFLFDKRIPKIDDICKPCERKSKR